MICYESCYLIEFSTAIRGEDRKITGLGEWRVHSCCATNIRPDQIIEEIDPFAKCNSEEYPRPDLYFNKESSVLWRVQQSRFYTTTKKIQESQDSFLAEYESHKKEIENKKAQAFSKTKEISGNECPL